MQPMAEKSAGLWSDKSVLQRLPGEYDWNYRVDGDCPGILKIMHAGCKPGIVDLQVAILKRLATATGLPVPRVVASRSGNDVESVTTAEETRLAWMISVLPGCTFAEAGVDDSALMQDIGVVLARLHLALQDFTHEGLTRELKWDLTAAEQFEAHLPLIHDQTRGALLRQIFSDYKSYYQPVLKSLPYQAIHNDLNDHNILVTTGEVPRLSGIIDFGDAIYGPVLADLAITAAYLVLGCQRPVERLVAFIAGYQSVRELSDVETDAIWPLLLTRLAVSVCNSAAMKIEKPDDPYVVVSEAPAWRFLDNHHRTDATSVSLRLRQTSTQTAGRTSTVEKFLQHARGSFARVINRELHNAVVLNFSPQQSSVPADPFQFQLSDMNTMVDAALGDSKTGIGRYAEPRLIYTSAQFFQASEKHAIRRTVHLGVDLFAPALTPVHAPLSGEVSYAAWQQGTLEYGGMVVLQHCVPDTEHTFYTLYGHLSRDSVAALAIGQSIAAGECFAELGTVDDNGGWSPHLHLQLGIGTGNLSDWPGVVAPDDTTAWKQIFPNPAALLNLPDSDIEYAPINPQQTALRRHKVTAPNLKLSYRDPVQMVRGWKQYLFDDQGRCYLDAYNNVPHVGHCHPHVTRAITDQVRLLSTNTRYISEGLPDYAERLLTRFPAALDTCFLVSSGSEANEVALRLARQFTGADDVLVSESGYHGITQTCIDISHYKFARPGGAGQKEWVHVIDVPDTYRGRHRGDHAAQHFVADVESKINDLQASGRRLACFISEPFPSVGGQVIPPAGYLAGVYEVVRNSGALNIADEVQTGLGRLGQCDWGFSYQQAVPDIVVLGKPAGNGHPLGVVITRREIADAFATGMEFFSTFGGSTVACAAGLAVLEVLDEEELATNAEVVGSHLLQGLTALQKLHPIIGDVRGVGLFIGADLTRSDNSPATAAAAYIVNRLRDHRILIGSDGPFDNVLKIRPPLCFSIEDTDCLLQVLDSVLGEAGLQALA